VQGRKKLPSNSGGTGDGIGQIAHKKRYWGDVAQIAVERRIRQVRKKM
jgi:hypothetical protein